jgi:hypothetical protein
MSWKMEHAFDLIDSLFCSLFHFLVPYLRGYLGTQVISSFSSFVFTSSSISMQIYIELEASQVEKVDKHIKVAHGQLYDVSNGCFEIVLIIDFHMN